jgi:hypothetical protein
MAFVSLHPAHVGSLTRHYSKPLLMTKNQTMRANPRDAGGAPPRHGVVQVVDTAAKVAGLVQGIYSAGKVIAPYVRPALATLAAAA